MPHAKSISSNTSAVGTPGSVLSMNKSSVAQHNQRSNSGVSQSSNLGVSQTNIPMQGSNQGYTQSSIHGIQSSTTFGNNVNVSGANHGSVPSIVHTSLHGSNQGSQPSSNISINVPYSMHSNIPTTKITQHVEPQRQNSQPVPEQLAFRQGVGQISVPASPEPGSVTPVGGPPTYPPPELPSGVQPPALPPGTRFPVPSQGGVRPVRPPPIPSRNLPPGMKCLKNASNKNGLY